VIFVADARGSAYKVGMKSLILAPALFLVQAVMSNASATSNNPLRRICLQYQAEFVVFQTESDDLATCKVGPAYLGALDLLLLKNEGQEPLAVQRFLRGEKDCPGLIESLQTLEGVEIQFCRFSDGSTLDRLTQQSGRENPRNEHLLSVLSVTTQKQ
jgi:hypothetical protein